MFLVRAHLDKAHVALLYLLLILGCSARSGRAIGLMLSGAAFLAFNFFFVPPYHTLLVAEPLDWLVLATFLVTSTVAAQLLARAQSEAAAARDWAAEVDSLSALGAKALNAGRAADALVAIAEVIRDSLDVAQCEIFLRNEKEDGPQSVAVSGQIGTVAGEDNPVAVLGDEQPQQAWGPSRDSLVNWVSVNGRAAWVRPNGAIRVSSDSTSGNDAATDIEAASLLLLPLSVQGSIVGVLRLVQPAGLLLDHGRQRRLKALSYYAALGLERVRLVAEAEHAEALREADELKNALLASVSHDLRTPLTTIKALAHDIGADGDARADVIEAEADRLNRFVADLLDLSRIASKSLGLNPEIIPLEDLIGVAVQRVGGALNGRRIAVHLDTAAPPLLGRFDFVHSLRIVVNLVDNALKYSPPDAPVEIRVRSAPAVVEILVEDRGPGIPDSETERIFEPFYRPADRPADASGAGLGLSIARQLAEAQGGKLRYQPRSGGGSMFALELPRAEMG